MSVAFALPGYRQRRCSSADSMTPARPTIGKASPVGICKCHCVGLHTPAPYRASLTLHPARVKCVPPPPHHPCKPNALLERGEEETERTADTAPRRWRLSTTSDRSMKIFPYIDVHTYLYVPYIQFLIRAASAAAPSEGQGNCSSTCLRTKRSRRFSQPIFPLPVSGAKSKEPIADSHRPAEQSCDRIPLSHFLLHSAHVQGF